MSRKKNKQNKPATNTLRIIGGEWRGRKLQFVSAEGLRPTPDRVRETLFNWLQGQVHGARCLDLFAGSGALGIEALSRGANEVVFVDSVKQVTQQLQANLALLKSDACVLHCDAQSYLANTDLKFDIIFLDPPFRQNMLEPILKTITKKQLLNNHGHIYLEQEAEQIFDESQFGLLTIKQKKAGNVRYYLSKTERIN